jgi:hypothetical protein
VLGGVLVAAMACSARPERGDGPRIAVLFDGSWGDADEVTGPTLAGLRFAALGTGDPETIQPLNVGDEGATELLGEVASDPAVVAAVVAPWTTPPAGAQEVLARARMPVVSLTWSWGPPAPDAAYVRLAPDRRTEADLLAAAGGRAADVTIPRCVAGDTHPTSGPLSRGVVEAARRIGSTLGRAGVVDVDEPETAEAVARRLDDRGCRVALWTGGAEALELLVDAAPDLRTVVATSRVKSAGGIGVGVAHPARRIVTVCACADISLTRRPDLQRFIHDYQTESGSDPGPFAVEAYDVGRWLLEAAVDGRRGVADRIRLAGAVDGLLGTYRLDASGSLVSAPTPPASWRAFGSRWLPLARTEVPSLVSALLPAALVARVRPRMRPRRARDIHRSRRER